MVLLLFLSVNLRERFELVKVTGAEKELLVDAPCVRAAAVNEVNKVS